LKIIFNVGVGDALDAVDAVDASRLFRPAQVETRLGRYLEDKHIFYSTSTYGFRRVKHYKVMEYDLDAKKYTVIDWDVNGPIEYIEILDEKNIEVYVESIPVEESSEEEEDDDDDEEEEVSAPFTAEDVRNMKKPALQEQCIKYKLFNPDWPQKYARVPEMKEALMNKFGLEGSTVSDWQQKLDESSNALDAFLKLASVVAITSKIRNFNPKNRDHAASFLEQYRKKHGKGPTRSRK
jgi:hypothetical protein